MSTQESLISTIFIITAIFSLVGVFVVWYFLQFNLRKKKLLEENLQMKAAFDNQLLRSQIEVQEETFSTLGKELHDNIGQLLGTAKMLIGVSQRNLASSADTIRTADETISKAIYELRSLSKMLNKEWLQQFDFRENLQTELVRINSAGTVQLSLIDNAGKLWLSAEEQIILFRIVQEAVQNALKHAEATAVTIQLSSDEVSLQITVTDNGVGLKINHAPGGVGMMNMKHRISLLQGSINWTPESAGTTVTIHLPQTIQA